MVKTFFFIAISFNTLFANTLLQEKILHLVEEKTYATHKGLIDVLFQNKKDFLINEHANTVKIIKVLKDNGLFELIYKKPTQISVSFRAKKTDSLLLAVKAFHETLAKLGLDFFTTKKMEHNNELLWIINFKAYLALDPVAFSDELLKWGIVTLDITRKDSTNWIYDFDLTNARLGNAIKIGINSKTPFTNVKNDIFLEPYDDLKNNTKLIITSSLSNTWYPHIVFYDKNLNSLQTKIVNQITRHFIAYIPKGTVYIKISDRYFTDNYKYGFKILLKD